MKKEDLLIQHRVLKFLKHYDSRFDLTITAIARYFGVTRQYIRTLASAHQLKLSFSVQVVSEYEANKLKVNENYMFLIENRNLPTEELMNKTGYSFQLVSSFKEKFPMI